MQMLSSSKAQHLILVGGGVDALLLSPMGAQDAFGVAVGFVAAFEDEFRGGLERDAGVVVERHWFIGRVFDVLLVYEVGHAAQRGVDLGGRDDAVVEPVGDVLAGDAQRGEVLHEADVGDVGHGRAADALADPAHDVAEDALAVGFEFSFDDSFGEFTAWGEDGQGDEVFDGRCGAVSEVTLAGFDVDGEVVHGVQCGGGGGGHPGAASAGEGVLDFGADHGDHFGGHGPHAFADLGTAGESGGEA